MDMEKIFSDLESNQPHECEESKKKLLDCCSQTKEQWPVQHMMDYFLLTGSIRIMEVLVRVQVPHDIYIFDRLDDWLKNHRIQALNVFYFIVRRQPTWLYKIEKHKFIKSVFKLLTIEKEIVPLMGALLGIITLLPIIPNSVPIFLPDLFEVFGHLASWKLQNNNKLPDVKLVHLQLGLQMLFHRLYGMYPCNFLAYLSDFIKKDKGGGVFQHTIKPLLETVRVHPLLLTATTESEKDNLRWKEIEPHDVVVECAYLSLPAVHPDFNNESNSSAATHPVTPISMLCSPHSFNQTTPSTASSINYICRMKDLQKTPGPVPQFDTGDAGSSYIWSPENEIATAGTIPLTPTPSYILPKAPSSAAQLLSVTGSSPPEAAVEATPETTPMKDVRELKLSGSAAGKSNPHAVRAILMSSQPSSPMRKEHSQFCFPEVNAAGSIANQPSITLADHGVGERYNTETKVSSYDQRLKQVLQDRSEVEALSTIPLDDLRSPKYASSAPVVDITEQTARRTPVSALPSGKSLVSTAALDQICRECNETEKNLCSVGGLHMPTSRSMQQLAKGIKRRNRMASYCYNESSYEKTGYSVYNSKPENLNPEGKNVFVARRTTSCPSLSVMLLAANKIDDNLKPQKNGIDLTNLASQKPGGRLQKSGKMLAIATAKNLLTETRDCTNTATQTVDTVLKNYENALFDLLFENKEQSNNIASNVLQPHDILDQYVTRAVQVKENIDITSQYQLLSMQLEYERYRRGIHAERNRRLMGRSRDKRSLEMERDRLCEQLKSFDLSNKSIMAELDKVLKMSKKSAQTNSEQLAELKAQLQHEKEQNKSLQKTNDELIARLNEELPKRKDINYELEALRGQIFTLNTELQHAQQHADKGLLYKQELERLEAEFIVMGEIQLRCRDRLAEVDNYRARDEELQMLQDCYNMELKELRHNLADKICQLDSTKHTIIELQDKLANSEKTITEQKRLLRNTKDEYAEMFKALNKKYEVQKQIILQMEEKILISLQKPTVATGQNTCSPDTDRTDIASSMERNSPLSTSLASSESLSASLRSSELKNLQQLVETPSIPEVISSAFGENRMASVDLASSANTANTIEVMHPSGLMSDLPSTSSSALEERQQQQ